MTAVAETPARPVNRTWRKLRANRSALVGSAIVTLFVGLAMVESTAIYCFVISMILIFANPFWNHFLQATSR